MDTSSWWLHLSNNLTIYNRKKDAPFFWVEFFFRGKRISFTRARFHSKSNEVVSHATVLLFLIKEGGVCYFLKKKGFLFCCLWHRRTGISCWKSVSSDTQHKSSKVDKKIKNKRLCSFFGKKKSTYTIFFPWNITFYSALINLCRVVVVALALPCLDTVCVYILCKPSGAIMLLHS